MTCKYILDGIEFNSEEQLNDFLLNLEGNNFKLSDVVFQKLDGTRGKRTAEQNNYLKIFLKAEEKYKELVQLGILVRSLEETEEVEPEDLDDIGTLKYPYISLTDSLHTLRGRDPNKYALAIFRSEEYWSHEFDRFKNGIFDPYYLLFIGNLLEKNPDGSYKPVTNQKVLEKIRDRIEGYEKNGIRRGGLWKLLATCGNLVHDVFARFYRDTVPVKNPDGTYVRNPDGKVKKGAHLYELKNDKKLVLEYYKEHLRDEFKPYYNDDVLNSIIELCFAFDEELRAEYGENCFVRTEQKVIADLNLKQGDGKTATKIIGKIDLVVIGDVNHKGKVGIIDFKCSPKDYTTSNAQNDPFLYNSAKILTFKYQLAMYRRILEAMGVRPQTEIGLYVCPLKFEDFKMSERGKVSFSGISSLKKYNSNNTMMLELSNSRGGKEHTNIESNLDLIFPSRSDLYVRTSSETTDVIETTRKVTKEWLSKVDKNKSAEDYLKYIEDGGGIKFDELEGKYYFKPNKYNDNGIITINAKTKEEATAKVIEELKRRETYNESYVVNTTRSMRKTFNDYYYNTSLENPIETILNYASPTSASRRDNNYLRSNFSKYSNKEIWEPVPKSNDDLLNTILDLFGILLFRNKASGLIDVIRISGEYNPAKRVLLKGNEYILGNYLPDSISHNSAESLTMISTVGNMELIESMVVINLLTGILKSDLVGIGNIKLIHPSQLVGMEVPNEQLLYNFNRLCQQTPELITNNFKTGPNSTGFIKMATYLDKLKYDFKEIKTGTKEGLGKLRAEVKQSVSKFDFENKTLELIKLDLITLDLNLVKWLPDVVRNIQNRVNEDSPYDKLHKDILYAIAELSGVKMVQQIEAHKKWDARMFGKKKGISGTMVDNPGTLQSAILNLATNLVTIAYLNTRDSVVRFDLVLKEKVKKLKLFKGFGWASLNITGNQVKDLYYNMFDHKSSDVKFVNPWSDSSTLEPEEKEFLKYAIIKINSTRGNGLNLDEMLKNPDLMGELIKNDMSGKYLKVPLMKGDFSSEVAIRGGIFKFIKNRFRFFSAIWNLLVRLELRNKINDDITNLLDTEAETYLLINLGNQWEAVNNMSRLDDPDNSDYREKKLRERGKEYFEHNIETILLKLHSAYVMADELNKIFPVIQSLLIHLNALGCILNTEFTNDVKYLLDYIKTKVHNQPLEDRTKQEAVGRDIINETMKWASRLALAYNLRLTYLFLDGVWLAIKLTWKYPEFTKENLFWAWRYAMSDLFTKFGDKRSITELLNILYGINDMDMNTYIDRIKSDNTGIFTHFWDTGFRFASRPDYYNRMTIFLALMKNDGSFEAHSIKNGKLVYDWTQDKRFKAFAENSSDKAAYNKAKTAYITVAKQLMEEGTLNEDGTLFKMNILHPKDTPLPKAYSNKESEGRKAFSDRIYGYYSHEKKSMFNSTFLGALFMLMNTYWSAKKNQWVLLESYTQEGHWEDYVEDGVPYYWKINEETGELEVTKEVTGLPVQVWKGNPQEGIIVTLSKIVDAFKGKSEYVDSSGLKGLKELVLDEIFGDESTLDPDLKRLYRANIMQLLYDILMMILLGLFASNLMLSGAKEYAKEHKNDDFGNALANTALTLGTGIITSSATDFNPASSIIGRGIQWTPFAFTTALNVKSQFMSVIKGNLDFYDAIIKSSAAGRGTAPTWEYVKLNTIGTKIGEKEKD